MANERDLDILSKSQSGDWLSRIEFFKRFIGDSPRVRRLGLVYQNMDAFLHDVFTNVLRTTHSFQTGQNLGDWVQSVAAWTALERRRFRDVDSPGAQDPIRMCAGLEGDEAHNRARLASYVPPRSGPGDSLAGRVSALIGEPSFTLLSKRAVEGSTWEVAAAAVGKPLNTVGPMMVRTVDRLSRFFGAPPPLNADLEPVLTMVVRKEAAARHSDPSAARGRILSMQLDPAFYSVTPEMRRLGLNVPADVRTIVLWDAARTSSPPAEPLAGHLAKCHYCSDLLRAMRLMQRALKSNAAAPFLLCPGGFTLLNTSGQGFPALDQHLAECRLCREERNSLLGADQEPAQETRVSPPGSPGAGVGKKIALAAAAVVLLGGVFLAQHRNSTPKSETLPPVTAPVLEPPYPPVAVNPRYSDLAQAVSVTDLKWLSSVLPEDREVFGELIDRLQNRHMADATLAASGYAEKDPGIQMLYATILYEQSTSDGYRAMLRAESMSPRNSFRCWAMLQSALMVGDMKIAAREVDHLSSDPGYAARAKALLVRARSRG